jgi:hypothetical protein
VHPKKINFFFEGTTLIHPSSIFLKHWAASLHTNGDNMGNKGQSPLIPHTYPILNLGTTEESYNTSGKNKIIIKFQ